MRVPRSVPPALSILVLLLCCASLGHLGAHAASQHAAPDGAVEAHKLADVLATVSAMQSHAWAAQICDGVAAWRVHTVRVDAP
jgi:hypothetical protein